MKNTIEILTFLGYSEKAINVLSKKSTIRINSDDCKKLAKENKLTFYGTNHIHTFIQSRTFYILDLDIYLIGGNGRDFKIAKIN